MIDLEKLKGFTPGKWHLEQGSAAKKGEFCVVHDLPRDANGVINIRSIGKTFEYTGEAEAIANANLFAAAPDLLELAKLGLELAEVVAKTFKSPLYSCKMIELARALREKARKP